MKPAAARLLLLQGAHSYRRLAGIAAGVALGVALLLVLAGAYLHMPDRSERGVWAGVPEVAEVVPFDGAYAPSADIMLMERSSDYFGASFIAVVTVAVTGDTTVDFPAALPAPGAGEYYASPALAALIDAAPADELGDRYGSRVGELPPAMLKGPSQLVALVGEEWDALAASPQAMPTRAFNTAAQFNESSSYRLIIAIGTIALVVPIVLLISIVSQLGASERRERFATVRLIGAGRKAMALMAGAEMFVATCAGGIAGVGLSFVMLPVAATIPISSTTSFEADLTAPPAIMAATVVALALLGGGAAAWTTFRDDVGALGATRERSEKRVTPWRLVPLVIGIALLAGAGAAADSSWAAGALFVFGLLGGFALTAWGIVLAGPWITRAASGLYARRATTASGVVAAGRLSRHPRATFRAVGGLVLAVYLVSVFAGLTSGVAEMVTPRNSPGRIPADALVAELTPLADPAQLVSQVGDVEGATRVAIGWAPPGTDAEAVVFSHADASAIGATDVPDSDWVLVNFYDMTSSYDLSGAGPDPAVAAEGIDGLEARFAVVTTVGDAASIERARTSLATSAGVTDSPLTRTNAADMGSLSTTNQLAILAYLGMAVAVAIAAVSLTVSTISAAIDRKRTFALLRLGGMPATHVRRIVTKEAAVPLAVTVIASAGIGFLTAWILLEALSNGISMGWPDWRYAAALAVSVGIAVAAVTSSFSLVTRATEVTETRFE